MSINPVYEFEKTPDEIIEETKLKNEAVKKGEEFKEKETLDEFAYYPSSSSCSISDIEGMLIGGQSSRFWIYRKHMISMEYDILKFDN
jgi:hypothetical protein